MRTLTIIASLLFLTSFQMLGQQATTKSYKLIFDKYVFTTETTFEADTVNGNAPREYSYFFKNDRQIIKIPRRIDRTQRFNASDPNSVRIVIDTVDQIEVNKIVDTISKSHLNEMIGSELKIYYGFERLKFDEAHLETIQANGKSSYTIDLQKTKIKEGRLLLKKFRT